MELTTLIPLVVEHLEEMGQETMVIHWEAVVRVIPHTTLTVVDLEIFIQMVS